MTWIGVDIGGSHISAAQVRWDGRDAHVGPISEADVNTYLSAYEIITDWTAVIGKAIGHLTDYRVGIAMPGPFNYQNGISLIKDQEKMKSLFGLSVKELLAESLNINSRDIVFINDAEAFLLGESLAGAGRGFKNSIGFTLGTGLGSAIKIGDVVKDAKLWTAPFRNGIAENYLGTNWFRKYALEKYGLTISGVIDLLAGDINQQIVNEIFAEFGGALGEFLSQYIIRLQCQGVVLGGKITRASDYFLPYTQAFLANFDYPIEIKISKMEEKAMVVGACYSIVKNSNGWS